MAGRFIPPSEQYFDNSGNILAGGKLYFYDSGTAVAKDTYSDPDATTANTNPVILDAAGRTPNIYLDGSYKLIIKDSDDVQIEERDPVLAADDTTKGFAVWNAVTTYSVDDIVRASNNLLYISIANSNQNFEPSATATKWTQVELISTYNANETYAVGDIVKDSAGDIYKSLVGSNTGNTPSSSPSQWGSTIATSGVVEAVESSAVELGRDTPAAADVTTLDVSGVAKFNSTNSVLAGTPSTPNSSQKGWGVIDNAGAGRYVAASTSSTGLFSHYEFYNPNGTVGSIQSNGSATSYNTSSDPELKSEFLPIDDEWAAEILIQSVEEKWVGVFHFLADKAKTLVAGYNAWKLIDNIPGYGGSERRGPRDMKIGEVYEPAVTEMVDGEEVEISPEKRVSPAGVDQSKLVPLLHAALYNALKRIEALEKK